MFNDICTILTEDALDFLSSNASDQRPRDGQGRALTMTPAEWAQGGAE